MVFNEHDCRFYYRTLLHKHETEIRTVSPAFSYFVDNENDFVEKCRDLNGKTNVYCGVNERVRGGTKDDDVLSLRCIYFDLDPVREKGSKSTDEMKEKAMCKASEIMIYFKEKYDADSLMIDSGNGYHIYHFIPKTYNCECLRLKLRKWGQSLRRMFSDKDTNVDYSFNLSRIAKVPGTVNQNGDLCRIESVNYKRIDNWEIRKDILLTDIENNCKDYASKIVKNCKEVDLTGNHTELDYILKMDRRFYNIWNGNIFGFKSRSEAEFFLVSRLVTYGFSDDEIRYEMEKCRIGKWNDSAESYKIYTLRAARS